MTKENPLNRIANEFYKMRIKYGIGYVLTNSAEIVQKNCNYDLNNSEYQKFYNISFSKFRQKNRFAKEMEDKIMQTLEGYRGTYGLNYTLRNLKLIKNKVMQKNFNNQIVNSSYEKALKKFKDKYKEEIYGKNSSVKMKKAKVIYRLWQLFGPYF